MKKYLPYILVGLLIIAVGLLFFAGRTNKIRQLDERISFHKKDKIPYGFFVAYEGLKAIFPAAQIVSEKKEPGYWDSLSTYEDAQALIIVTPDFNASKSEMENIIDFVEIGNDVFISTMKTSFYAEKLMHTAMSSSANLGSLLYMQGMPDSLTISVSIPPGTRQSSFTYPGRSFDSWFYRYDSSISTVLGYDEDGKPDYIHLKAGKGNLYFHLAPMVFTNYFLLHKNNIGYYEKMLSVISPSTRKVVWDEYYVQKRSTPQEPKKGWLSVLMNMKNSAGQKPFRTAIWVLLLLLLLYVLIEMRRKQRFIPAVTKPRNDSLEFVKTIGRLYHDKGDHKNLCRKMAAYFLEHVRNRYKLTTSELDEQFINQLQFKTGVDETEIRGIVSFIREMDNTSVVTDRELAHFHKQLEKFYQYS